MGEKTDLFNIVLLKEELIKTTLREVEKSLTERGYDATNQIVGYLISGDPGYISNFKQAREKILGLDRSEIIKLLLASYLEK